MNWASAAAVGAVANQFGLGGTAGAVLDAAIGVESWRRDFVKRRNTMPRPYMPGQRPYKRQRVGTGARTRAVTVIRGHNLGDFQKRRENVSENIVTLHGYRAERETYGNVIGRKCLYIGAQSVNIVMVARAVAIALIRHIFWYEYSTTLVDEATRLFESASASVPPVCTNLRLWFKTRGSNVLDDVMTYQDFAITFTTTLGELANAVTSSILVNHSAWGCDTDNRSSRFYGYNVGNAVNRGPIVCCTDARLRLNVLTTISIQNATPGDGGGQTSEAINANPLTGKCYVMKGRNILCENATLAQTNDPFAKLLQTAWFTGSDDKVASGLLIPAVQPTAEFSTPPDPQIFSNIITCFRGLRLEPGDIRKDVLRFNFNGRLDDLMSGLATFSISSGVISESSYYEPGELGTVRLYSFYKDMPTGGDTLSVNYTLNRHITCVFSNIVTANTIRKPVVTETWEVVVPAPA